MAKDSIETEVSEKLHFHDGPHVEPLEYALVCNDVTFEIRLNIAYTVHLKIRQCQSQVRLAGLVSVTEWKTPLEPEGLKWHS